VVEELAYRVASVALESGALQGMSVVSGMGDSLLALAGCAAGQHLSWPEARLRKIARTS